MKLTDTISVNPSKTALGHIDASSSSILRSPVLVDDSSSKAIDLVKVLFPSSAAGTNEYKKYAVPLRTLFATILIVSGLSILTGPLALHSLGFAISTICFGGILALGLFTRPVMLGASVFYCISGALALRAGSVDMTVFSLMFGCLIFCVIGSGKYSCDSIIRNKIMHHKKSSRSKEKVKDLGYKAFHKVKY